MTTATFERDGVRFAYEVDGEGPPLVLLHGLGGDRTQALAMAPALPFHRIAVDLRGHGDTEPVGGASAYGFGPFADDLAALLEQVVGKPAVVIGVSMGAGVALRFALTHPGRVTRLVLARPAWTNQPMTPNLVVFTEIAHLLRTCGPDDGLKAFKASLSYQAFRRRSRYCTATLCEQFAKPKAVARAVRLEQLPRSVPYASDAELGRLAVPALVIGTRNDPLHPTSVARAWARSLRAGTYREVVSKTHDRLAHDEAVRHETGAFLSLMAAGRRCDSP